MTGAEELAALARAGGEHLSWAQAAGGNASIKDEASDTLWVKASGLRLRELEKGKGWVSVSLKAARELLADEGLEALPHAKQQDEAGRRLAAHLKPDSPPGRASLEAEFHALGGRACLHVHLVSCLGPLSLKGARAWFDKALAPYSVNFAWAGFRPPGHALARQVRSGLAERPAGLCLMKNHGVIAWGQDGAEALQRLRWLDKAVQGILGPVEAPKAAAFPRDFQGLEPEVAALFGEGSRWKVSHDPWVASLSLGGEWAWAPLCPDDPIYCGLKVPTLKALPTDLKALFGPAPRQAAFAIEGSGTVLMARDEKALTYMEELLSANAKARCWGRSAGDLEPLSQAQCREILGMDGEKYRQGL